MRSAPGWLYFTVLWSLETKDSVRRCRCRCRCRCLPGDVESSQGDTPKRGGGGARPSKRRRWPSLYARRPLWRCAVRRVAASPDGYYKRLNALICEETLFLIVIGHFHGSRPSFPVASPPLLCLPSTPYSASVVYSVTSLLCLTLPATASFPHRVARYPAGEHFASAALFGA